MPQACGGGCRPAGKLSNWPSAGMMVVGHSPAILNRDQRAQKD